MSSFKILFVTALILSIYPAYAQHGGMDMSSAQANAQASPPAMDRNMLPDAVAERFKEFASKIDVSKLNELPVQNRGRIKPLETFSREALLFLTGKYSMFGLSPVQMYLGLITFPDSQYLEIANIRDPELRTKLGYSKEQRWVSFYQLSNSKLQELSAPILEKQKQNERSVTPDEKKTLEVVQQFFMGRELLAGDQFFQAINLNVENIGETAGAAHEHGPVFEMGRSLLQALAAQDSIKSIRSASDLKVVSEQQKMPEMFKPYLDKMGAEVVYNHFRPFFFAAILYLLMGCLLIARLPKNMLSKNKILMVIVPIALLHLLGFAVRVYITGFAPVTSMYGTMIWMSFGVVLFGTLLFYLYENYIMMGTLLLGASAVLFLTESIPLVLSPDLDPIVAVLRNNFWLTIHVMTISISYAALTISMLLGNVVLVRTILGKGNLTSENEFVKTQSHLVYRAVQLGVFLLTVGIILGGWWADYSWGRFWGWDPKETWALIADIGYIAILHARYLGWLGPYGLLAAAPMAYLLVIMAWYGVNFILAAGLHSYGFSSGGATIVLTFVIVQFVIFAAAMIMKNKNKLLKKV